MKNKFITKLKFVWNNIKSSFENFKKNAGYFFRSIRMTFTAKKVQAEHNAEEKRKRKEAEKNLAAQNERAASEKRSEESSKAEYEDIKINSTANFEDAAKKIAALFLQKMMSRKLKKIFLSRKKKQHVRFCIFLIFWQA